MSREIGSLVALSGLSHSGAFLQSQAPLQTETTLMFSLLVFFRLIHVSAGMNTNAPGWASYSLRYAAMTYGAQPLVPRRIPWFCPGIFSS